MGSMSWTTLRVGSTLLANLHSVRAEPTGSGEGQGLLWDNVSELTPVIRDVLKS